MPLSDWNNKPSKPTATASVQVQTTPLATPLSASLVSTPAARSDNGATAWRTNETQDDRLGLQPGDALNTELQSQRIRVDDKAMINCRADLNQLIPLKYKWAWEKYTLARRNHWMPDEIKMDGDVSQWNTPGLLTEEERKVVKRSLGFFSTADSLVANNIVLGVYRLLTNPECRQYLLLQASEEALHTHAYLYCIESLDMDQGELFNMYHEIPSVGAKTLWALDHTAKLSDPTFQTGTPLADRQLLENLIAYYCVVEGLFFYCGFALILAMARHGKMINTAKQFEMIMRDESMHINFGVDVINQIKAENPHLWDADLQAKTITMIKEGLDLEVAFARDTMPRGIEGMNVQLMTEYLQYIANRRFVSLQLPEQYSVHENPFHWMTRAIDQQKNVSFFEQDVADYQQGGGIDWDAA